MGGILIGFIAFVLAITCVSACGEDSDKIYNVRQRRSKLSENVVIGMDFGKPKIVCHCDAAGLQKLASKRFLTLTKRDTILTVRPKRDVAERRDNLSKTEDQRLQNDPVYSTTCCKIDLSNPRKLYSYPFTLKLGQQTYSDKLANKTSEDYLQLKKQLIDGLTAILANEGCVVAIELSGFRKGSVLADIVLSVQGPISQSIIDTLRSAIESGNIGGLQVQIVPEPEPTESPATQSPTKALTQPAVQPRNKPLPVFLKKTNPPGSYSTTKSTLTELTSITPNSSSTVTPNSSSTVTPKSSSTVTPKSSPTVTPTSSPTVTPKSSSTVTPKSSSTVTPKSSPTVTPKSSSTVTPKSSPTVTPKSSPTVTPKSSPTVTPKSSSTVTPKSSPTVTPKSSPTVTPKSSPTVTPKSSPTVTPTSSPAKPKIPTDGRPTLPYDTNTPGKEFKVNIALPEKSFDPNLNNPSSSQFIELKKMVELSLNETYKNNAEFLSVTVVSFGPASSSSSTGSRRSSQPLKGVEVTLHFQFRTARPGLLVELETQLKTGSIAGHAVSPDMNAVIVKDTLQSSSLTVAPTPASTVAPKPASTVAPTPAPTAGPSATPAPAKPKIPTDSRPTLPYNTNTPGKEFKVNIILPEKSFDPNLNRPSSFQYMELKKMIELSLKEIFQSNAEFLSVTVVSFAPASSSSSTASRRSSQLLKGVEVTLDFKFRYARPGLLVQLETQLKIGSIASHAVSPDMAAVIIKDMQSSGQCPSTCRQPSVCAPACSTICCSPPAQVPSCPLPCPARCAPSCNLSCCALTKRSFLTSQN